MSDQVTLQELDDSLYTLEQRIARIETRLCQLMVFLGANPYGENPPAVVRKRGDRRRNVSTREHIY